VTYPLPKVALDFDSVRDIAPGTGALVGGAIAAVRNRKAPTHLIRRVAEGAALGATAAWVPTDAAHVIRKLRARAPAKKDGAIPKVATLRDSRRRERPDLLRKHVEAEMSEALPAGVRVSDIEHGRVLGLFSPYAEVGLVDKDGSSVLEPDGFSGDRVRVSLHKRPFRKKWDMSLDALYLLPEHRGKGVGSEVARRLIAAARGLGTERALIEAERDGKAAWARIPGVDFQRGMRQDARAAYRRWRKKNGGPVLPKDAPPSAYPKDFLLQWNPPPVGFASYEVKTASVVKSLTLAGVAAVPGSVVGSMAGAASTPEDRKRGALRGAAIGAGVAGGGALAIDLPGKAVKAYVRARRNALHRRGAQKIDLPTPNEIESLGSLLTVLTTASATPIAAAYRPKKHTKTANAQDGHWRKLKPGQEGSGPAGEPTAGKTWVHRNRVRSWVKPYDHQQRAMRAAIHNDKRGKGTVFAHGTGTGKTLGSIMTFEELKARGEAKRALVLVPAGLRNNFKTKGVEKFTESNSKILTKPEELSDDIEYAVVSYAAFRRRPTEFLAAVRPDTLILDEAQRALNYGTQTRRSVLLARDYVKRTLALTASITSNSPAELAPAMALVNKDPAYRSKEHFEREHIKMRPGTVPGPTGKVRDEPTLVDIDELYDSLDGTIHFIEDMDGTAKPKEVDEHVSVEMNKVQYRQYKRLMKGLPVDILRDIEDGKAIEGKRYQNVLSRLTKGRQAVNSVAAAGPYTPEQAAEMTPKIVRILDDTQARLQEVPDAQVIIYGNFVNNGLDAVAAGLAQRGIEYGVFAGEGQLGSDKVKRQQDVDRYNAGELKVILLSPAGAEGLSLNNTTHVMLLDGHYNPERTNQAKARGIRAGGQPHRAPEDRKVVVTRYVTTLPKGFWRSLMGKQRASIDEAVWHTSERKGRLNDQVRDVLKKDTERRDKRRESGIYKLFHPKEHSGMLDMDKAARLYDVAYGKSLAGLGRVRAPKPRMGRPKLPKVPRIPKPPKVRTQQVPALPPIR
jgi:GNAT superfamily N-acetyltransferase